MLFKTMEKTPITLLTTGGTIEKSYDEKKGSIVNKETMIQARVLSKLRLPHTQVSVRYLMNKDSSEMDEQDREIIRQAIEKFSEYGAPIIVVHGTDTMADTAKYCFDNVPSPKVAVIFTGAMKPLGFDDSDAKQNVVEALSLAKVMKPGFYISFHNQVFMVPKVRKNRDLGTFEKI